MNWIKDNFKTILSLLALFSGGTGAVWSQMVTGIKAEAKLEVHAEYQPKLDTANAHKDKALRQKDAAQFRATTWKLRLDECE